MGARRNPSRAKPDRSGVPINRMVVQRAASSRPRTGASRPRIRPPQREYGPRATSPPTVRSVHSTGVPAAPAVTRPTGRIWSDVEHLQPRVARPARARTPPSRGRGRTCAAARRPGPSTVAARPAASSSARSVATTSSGPRRPPGRARASPRAPRSAARSASRPVRCSSPGSSSRSSRLEEARDRPVGHGLQRRDVGPQPVRQPLEQVRRQRRQPRAAAPAARSAASRSTVRGEQRPRRVRIRRRHVRQQPAGRFAAARLGHPGRVAVEPVPRGAAPPGRR